MYDGGDTSELPDLTMNQSSALTSLAQYDLMSDTNMDQLNLQIEKERSVPASSAAGRGGGAGCVGGAL